jgi:predicted flap endonuclease-1-like 5' DNA nuclease
VIVEPQVGLGQQTGQAGLVKASYTRQGVQTYKRTDFKALVRTQSKGLKFTGQLAGASVVNMAEAAPRKSVGVKKQALMNSPVNDAVKELDKNQVEVVGIQKYDSKKANTYLAEYISTPQRLEPGSQVTLYQKDDKVMFYAVEKPAAAVTAEIPETVKAELEQFESRKAALADFSAVNAELARVEKQRTEVAELAAVRTELTNLQSAKASVEEELTAIKSQVDAIKAEREALAKDITTLKQGLTEMDTMRKQIQLEITKDRPVKEISGVGPTIDTELRELGIRTVAELAAADAKTLTATGRIKAGTAQNIITAARKRLAS